MLDFFVTLCFWIRVGLDLSQGSSVIMTQSHKLLTPQLLQLSVRHHSSYVESITTLFSFLCSRISAERTTKVGCKRTAAVPCHLSAFSEKGSMKSQLKKPYIKLFKSVSRLWFCTSFQVVSWAREWNCWHRNLYAGHQLQFSRRLWQANFFIKTIKFALFVFWRRTSK